MDIIIPLGNESRHHNLELKYCLLAVKKHLQGYNAIYVIGENPNVDGVIHLPFTESNNTAYRNYNIYKKILFACETKYISDPFLLLYDDHIFLKDFNVNDIPYYQQGTIGVNGWNTTANYYHTLKNTIDLMGNVTNFDNHSPLIIHMDKFKKIKVDWQKPHGYCIKTLYCNLSGIKGIYHKDFKVKRETSKQDIYRMIETQPFISLPHGILSKSISDVLKELFEKEVIL